MSLHDHETKSRLLAKLVRELLASERFATLADLSDALAFRCAKLKIRCTPTDVSAAYRLIASNRELASVPAVLERRTRKTPVAPEPEVISAAHASKLYKEIIDRYRDEQPAQTPTATPEKPVNFPNLVKL